VSHIDAVDDAVIVLFFYRVSPRLKSQSTTRQVSCQAILKIDVKNGGTDPHGIAFYRD
jgi:hypothetical protein